MPMNIFLINGVCVCAGVTSGPRWQWNSTFCTPARSTGIRLWAFSGASKCKDLGLSACKKLPYWPRNCGTSTQWIWFINKMELILSLFYLYQLIIPKCSSTGEWKIVVWAFYVEIPSLKGKMKTKTKKLPTFIYLRWFSSEIHSYCLIGMGQLGETTARRPRWGPALPLGST